MTFLYKFIFYWLAVLICICISMLERCYQWDNPDYVEKHYENSEKKEFWDEKISKALKDNLWEGKPIIPVTVDKNSERSNQTGDPKDALYFVDL